jgi:hypothetical protein
LVSGISKLPKPEIRPPENASNEATTEHCLNCNGTTSLFNMRSIIVPHQNLAVKFVECFVFCTGKQVDDDIDEPKVCLKCWQQIKADFEAKVKKSASQSPVTSDNKSKNAKKASKMSQESVAGSKSSEEDEMVDQDSEQKEDADFRISDESSNVSEEIIEELPRPKTKRQMPRRKDKIAEPELVIVQPIAEESEGEDHNTLDIFSENSDNSEVELDENADEEDLTGPKRIRHQNISSTMKESDDSDKESDELQHSNNDSEMPNEEEPKARVLKRKLPLKRKRGSSVNESFSASSDDDLDEKTSNASVDSNEMAITQDNKDEDYTISDEYELPEPKLRTSKRRLKKPKRYIETSPENSDDSQVESKELRVSKSQRKNPSQHQLVNKDMSEMSEAEENSSTLPKLKSIDDDVTLEDSEDKDNDLTDELSDEELPEIAGPSRKVAAKRRSAEEAEPESCEVLMETTEEIGE